MYTKVAIGILFIFLLIVGGIYFHQTDSFDQDLGRHLALGKIILETHQVPKTNLFSYTNSQEPVIDSHWGSQVVFYVLFTAFGTNGLIILSTVCNLLAFGCILYGSFRKKGVLISMGVALPFLFLLSDRMMIRPEMFSNLFFAFLVLCLFEKRLESKAKWSFPLISLLWINLHITALLGVVTMLLVLAQEWKDTDYKRAILYKNSLIAFLILLSLFITPFGFNLFLFTFTWASKYGYTIVENQSWWFLKDFGFDLVGHILLGILVVLSSFGFFVIRKRTVSIAEALLLTVITIATLRYVRNETFFAYIGFITSAYNLPSLKSWEQKHIGQMVGIGCVFLILSAMLVNTFLSQKQFSLGLGEKDAYADGVTYFKTHNLKGPIFNNFDIGGYLIYALYPSEKVFVDNRPEAYPVSFFEDIYKPMQQDPALFAQKVKEYHIQTVIWSATDMTEWSGSFLISLSQNPDWEKVYDDQKTLIYIKKSARM